MSTIAHNQVLVTGGVDTHKDTHTAAAIDAAGRMLGSAQFPATAAGYAALLNWLGGLGQLALVGVEGTGVYGAGLARYLHSQLVPVVEVDRPDRKTRRWQGKSDPVDAEAAARAALAARATGTPKHRTGQVEALRNLQVARRCAISHRADIQRRLHALVVTAPEPLRGRLHSLTPTQLVAACAALRPDPARAGEPATAAKLALRQLARRHQQLTTEITELDALIGPLVTTINPTLLAVRGVGPDVAGQLLITAGDNPTGCAQKPPSPCSAASPPCRPPPARPTGTGSTAVVTEGPTAPCGASSLPAWPPIPAPAPTATGAPRKECPSPRSSDASSVTSPARSTHYSRPAGIILIPSLTNHRSIRVRTSISSPPGGSG